MSPMRPRPGSARAKASTSVGSGRPFQRALSSRIRPGPTKVSETAAARRSQRSTVVAARMTASRESGAWRPVIVTSPGRSSGPPSAVLILGIRSNDLPHQAVPDHVAVAEVAERDPVDARENPLDLEEARVLPAGQIDLGLVAGHHDLAVHTETGEEHLHLEPGGVLGLVEDDERVGQGPAPHVGQRGDLDGPLLEGLLDPLLRHHVLEPVVARAEIRIHLGLEAAREEPQRLARLQAKVDPYLR